MITGGSSADFDTKR
jgi:hypothetical protein